MKWVHGFENNKNLMRGIKLKLLLVTDPSFTCSKLTIKIPERCHWPRSGVFIVNFEHVPHLALVFLLLILNMYCRIGNKGVTHNKKVIFLIAFI